MVAFSAFTVCVHIGWYWARSVLIHSSWQVTLFVLMNIQCKFISFYKVTSVFIGCVQFKFILWDRLNWLLLDVFSVNSFFHSYHIVYKFYLSGLNGCFFQRVLTKFTLASLINCLWARQQLMWLAERVTLHWMGPKTKNETCLREWVLTEPAQLHSKRLVRNNVFTLNELYNSQWNRYGGMNLNRTRPTATNVTCQKELIYPERDQ